MDVTVQAGDWCPELDLTPDAITSVTFAAEDLGAVEVVIVGNTAPVRWTCDGTDPSEDAGWYVPIDGVDEREARYSPNDGRSRRTVVKLWTSGTAKACVQRA